MKRLTWTRRIQFDGADPDFMYFSTPSWTRGSRIIHHLTVCKRSGVASCTCENAYFQKRKGDVLDPESDGPCKHVRRLLQTFARIITERIETAVAA